MQIKFHIILLLCYGLTKMGTAQCPTASITLDSQIAIDNFSTDYPGCTVIPIGVNITIDDVAAGGITNLDGLSEITFTGGEIKIRNNTALTNLDGLSQLASVGQSFDIRNNDALTNVNGLSQLTSVGQDFWIQSNEVLTNVDGLALALVGGELKIRNNANLANVNGLSQLISIGEDLVLEDNLALTNVDGLSQLVSINEQLRIERNAALTNVDGLSQVTSVGQHLHIVDNLALTNVDGLSQITSIGGNHSIEGNAALMNVDGLSQVTTIGGELVISQNSILANVNGFNQLAFIGGNLDVLDNPQLNECCAFCPLLAADAAQSNTIFGAININGNLSGCNSPAEISACTPCSVVTSISIPEYASSQLNIYPNPARHILHFQYDSTKDELVYFSVENYLGQRLIQSQARTNQLVSIDVSDYPAGLYILNVLRGDESVSQLFSVSR